MKKKSGILALCMSLVLSACSLSDIGLQRQDPVIEEEEEEEIFIELSDKKIEINAGEEAEVEIENYDDLSKVKVEAEDDDIAEAVIDDEIIIITGISGGKTKVVVSAKGCDDVLISVNVNDPDIEPAAEYILAPHYESVVYMDDEYWENGYAGGIYDEEEHEVAQSMIEFYENVNLGVTFYMDFTIDGDANEGNAVFYMDADKFGQDIVDALYDDEVFYNLVVALCELDGNGTADPELVEMMLEQKDYIVETLAASVAEGYDTSKVTFDVRWKLEGTTLVLIIDGEAYRCELNEDGSFTIPIHGNVNSENNFFAYDVNMDFYPVEE